MERSAYNFQRASKIVLTRTGEQVIRPGMIAVSCAVNLCSLLLWVGFPDILNMHNCQKKAFRVPECNGLADFEFVRLQLVDIKANWNRP